MNNYAEYLGRGGDGFEYVEPPKLELGEVPADLLARLAIAHRLLTRATRSPCRSFFNAPKLF